MGNVSEKGGGDIGANLLLVLSGGNQIWARRRPVHFVGGRDAPGSRGRAGNLRFLGCRIFARFLLPSFPLFSCLFHCYYRGAASAGRPGEKIYLRGNVRGEKARRKRFNSRQSANIEKKLIFALFNLTMVIRFSLQFVAFKA